MHSSSILFQSWTIALEVILIENFNNSRDKRAGCLSSHNSPQSSRVPSLLIHEIGQQSIFRVSPANVSIAAKEQKRHVARENEKGRIGGNHEFYSIRDNGERTTESSAFSSVHKTEMRGNTSQCFLAGGERSSGNESGEVKEK